MAAMRRRQPAAGSRSRALAALACAGLMVAACGGDSSGGGGSRSTPTAPVSNRTLLSSGSVQNIQSNGRPGPNCCPQRIEVLLDGVVVGGATQIHEGNMHWIIGRPAPSRGRHELRVRIAKQDYAYATYTSWGSLEIVEPNLTTSLDIELSKQQRTLRTGESFVWTFNVP